MKRLTALLLAISLVLSATAAWSFYKLAVTGETMAESAKKFLETFPAEQRAKVGAGV